MSLGWVHGRGGALLGPTGVKATQCRCAMSSSGQRRGLLLLAQLLTPRLHLADFFYEDFNQTTGIIINGDAATSSCVRDWKMGSLSKTTTIATLNTFGSDPPGCNMISSVPYKLAASSYISCTSPDAS